jgi:hypothetical protein
MKWGRGTECHGQEGIFERSQVQILALRQAIMYILSSSRQTAGSVHNLAVAITFHIPSNSLFTDHHIV